MIDHRGMTTYQWGDCCGQLVRVDNPDGSFMQYEYDNNKNITARITPWGRTEYSFDALNRNDSVYADDSTITAYFYDAIGGRDSTSNSNGTSVGYEFDNLNRLTGVTNYNSTGVISDFTYTVNDAGIKTSVTEADGSRVDYGYDNNYRLTSETRTGTNPYALAFTYDNVGNRLTKDLDGQVTSYTYNNRDQQTNEGVITYSYDASGRQTSKDSSGVVSSYTWMDNDRIQSVNNQNGTINFTYDLNGQKVRSDDGTNVTNYLIDHRLPYGQIIAEYQDGLVSDAVYTYGLERISQERSGTVSFYFTDGQLSVRQLTNSSGVVTDTYSYYGFGDDLSRSGSTENVFKYVGEELNGFTNLYNLRARWFEQGSGRFVSVDPWSGSRKNPLSLHRYLYANNSPISMADPSGKFSVFAATVVSNILAANAMPQFSGSKTCRPCLKKYWKNSEREIKSGGNFSKQVTFGFKEIGQKPSVKNKCCLVNFVRGYWKNDLGFVKATFYGTKVDVDFDNWVIDSYDNDPVFLAASDREYKQLYRNGWAYMPMPDRVGPIRPGEEADLDFKTCIMGCDKIKPNAKGTDPQALMGKSINCIDWNVKYTNNGPRIIQD